MSYVIHIANVIHKDDMYTLLCYITDGVIYEKQDSLLPFTQTQTQKLLNLNYIAKSHICVDCLRFDEC
jgi:hypothetical protein